MAQHASHSIVQLRDTEKVILNPATEEGQVATNASLDNIESDVDDIRILLSGGSAPVLVYGENATVATGISTLIATYTVPVGKSCDIKYVSVSGTNMAEYTLLVNSVVKDKRRTYYTYFNESFRGTITLAAGDIITIKVIHSRTTTGSFNTTIYGALK